MTALRRTAPTGHGGRLLTLRNIERPAIGRQRRAIGDQAHRDRSIERWEPAEYTDPDAGRPLAAMVATLGLLLALIVAVVLLCGAVTAGMA